MRFRPPEVNSQILGQNMNATIIPLKVKNLRNHFTHRGLEIYGELLSVTQLTGNSKCKRNITRQNVI